MGLRRFSRMQTLLSLKKEVIPKYSSRASSAAKGAWAGMTFSLALNSWMVIGRFFVSGKTPEPLPLSTDGCQALNGTLGVLANATFAVATTTPAQPLE